MISWKVSRAEDLLISGIPQKELGAFNYDELENYLYNVEVSSIPVVSSRFKEKPELVVEGVDKMLHDVKVCPLKLCPVFVMASHAH